MPEYRRHTNQPNPERRISVFIVIFTILLAVILYRLINIQIINSSKYQLAAKKQYEKNIPLIPQRGIIYDRKMTQLVTNVNQYTFAADPNMIDNKDSVAEIFSKIFLKDKSFYMDKLNSQNTSFVWLERHVDPKLEEQVKDINIAGVIKQTESRRIFNYDKTGSQVIGATDLDSKGLSGIEMGCNDELRGTEGYVVMQKDGLGRKRPALEYPRIDPKNGNSLVLTLDIDVQRIVEEELANGISANNSQGGKCVVMSVKTGEILGLYSFAQGENNFNKLSALTDVYEPGSTFKLVTASSSLEEGLQTRNDIINTYGGEYSLNGTPIKDSHKFASLSFQQVIEQSSNIGVIQIARKVGNERFYKYARDFGFGIPTGIDLPGEVRGILKRPVDFSPVSLGYMSIGYEVLVTALQMANAYACIGNNGILMQPYIVKKELTPDGKLVKENFPAQIRQVVSDKTAKIVTELLIGVVERGTGKEAHLENIRIAGKTGTAQKLVDGQYSKTFYTSSFIGFFPAENPQIVVAVIVDAPSAGEIYGGKVAAPIFKSIAERLIQVNGLMESIVPYQKPIEPDPNVIYAGNDLTDEYSVNLQGVELEDAVRILIEHKIDFIIEGPKKNAVVNGQRIIYEEGNKKLVLVTSDKSNSQKETADKNSDVMPNLCGMSVRKCIKILSSMGVEYKVSGTGKVISQKPEAGSNIKNQKALVICENFN